MSMGELFSEVGPIHGWAMATAALVSVGAAAVGSMLVVRKMSLLGDAISHAVLPGIVVAVLAGGQPGGPLVILGAIVAALLTVWLTHVLRRGVGLAEDASTGVVFTTFFSIGVILLTSVASQVDLDPGCVLYGILELVPFDTVTLYGCEIPRSFLNSLVVVGIVGLGLIVSWRLQVFVAFDLAGARAAGMPVALATIVLLLFTAMTVVAGFEAVGAILIVAMLVVPAAAAELLVHRMHHVVCMAVMLAVTGSIVGYLAAWHLNTNAAGMIAVVLGFEYALAVVFAPADGFVSDLMSVAWLRWRVACEDQLAMIWRFEESAGVRRVTPPKGLIDCVARQWLAVTGQIRSKNGQWRLDSYSRTKAESIVRSHRLWEAWLGRHADLPLDHLHPPAEFIEHHLGSRLLRQIEDDLGQERRDPHGSDIPPEQ